MAEPHRSPTHAVSRSSRGRHVLLGLLYFGALGLLMVWELRERVDFFAPECDRVETSPHSALYTQPYRVLLDWTSHDAPAQVSVVAIPSDLEEIRSNLCRARGYMADLLRAVETQGPAEIVIDKFYGPGACASDPATTEELRAAVGALGVPVVIGEATGMNAEPVAGSCLVTKPQLEFASANVHYGLTRLNVDTEKLPLEWKVLPAAVAAAAKNKEPEARDSLAWAAVKVYDPAYAARPRLQALVDAEMHPYANVRGELPRETSTELLCAAGTLAMRARWGVVCGPGAPKLNLRGKIVLIGSEDPVDQPRVLGTPMWGFDLQARYVDVLLAGNYLHELPLAAAILTFAAFVFLIEGLPTLLTVYRPRWKRHRVLRFAYPRRRYVWVAVGAIGCIVVSTSLSLVFRCLPPLAVLGDIVFVAITRLLLFAAEATEHPFVHGHAKGAH